VVVIQFMVLCVLMRYVPVDGYRRFGGTRRRHLCFEACRARLFWSMEGKDEIQNCRGQ
jgi:hypothetical protein